MKKINRIIILLSVLHFANIEHVTGQTTFFQWRITNTYEYIHSLILLKDSSCLLAGYGYPEGEIKNKGFLLKYDKNGNETGRRFSTEDIDNTFFSNSFQKQDTIFLLKSNYRIIADKNYDELWFCKINAADLTSETSKKYRFIANRICGPEDVLIENNNIFVLFTYHYNGTSFYPKGYFLYQFDYSFDPLASFYDTNYSYSIWGSGIVNNPLNHQLKSIVNFQYTTVINDFDYNLQNIKTNTINPYITAFATSKYDDSTYMTTGVRYQVEDPDRPIRYIVARKYNWNDVLLDSAYYYNTTDDTVSYSGFMKNTIRVDDRIFVSGTYNVDTHNWPYQQMPSWVELTIYDTLLNQLKKCFYGGDAFYECLAITKTLDNAVLIAGNRYDHNEPGYLYHPFVLKVTTDGLLTANENEPEKRAHNAIVFPNPGSDYLSVRSGPQIFGATFELFDLNGRLVKQEIISKQTTSVTTSDLASGTYVWRIIYKNKEAESGKWVKSL